MSNFLVQNGHVKCRTSHTGNSLSNIGRNRANRRTRNRHVLNLTRYTPGKRVVKSKRFLQRPGVTNRPIPCLGILIVLGFIPISNARAIGRLGPLSECKCQHRSNHPFWSSSCHHNHVATYVHPRPSSRTSHNGPGRAYLFFSFRIANFAAYG